MEDLRQHMKNLKSTRRRRALEASFDAVLADFPSDEKVRIRISKTIVVDTYDSSECTCLV